MSRVSSLLLLPAACCAAGAASPPKQTFTLKSDSGDYNSEPSCWVDTITGETLGCAKGFDDAYCAANFDSDGPPLNFNVAKQVEVVGMQTCALWLWGNTGSSFSVIWDGVPRGRVDADSCVELYVPPGYTMDSSNITLVCNSPLAGCEISYSANPSGTTCSADGSLTLNGIATAGIIASALCCCVLCASLFWCAFCRAAASSRSQYTSVYATAPAPAVVVAQGERAPIYVGIPVQDNHYVQTTGTVNANVCAPAPAPPPQPQV